MAATATASPAVFAGELRAAALRLRDRILELHDQGDALRGPDPGIRFHIRIGRFVRSSFPWLLKNPQHFYLQAQSYWVRDLLALHDLGEQPDGVERAARVAGAILALQNDDGSWPYPNPEWSGRLAALEGAFASRALLWVHERTGEPELLAAAERWHRCLLEKVGMQIWRGEGCFRYFGNVKRGVIPNSAIACLPFLAQLARESGDESVLEPLATHYRLALKCQKPSGEIPYMLEHEEGAGREHYLCYQYNAYQLLDLADTYALAPSDDALAVMHGLAKFVSSGLTAEGRLRKDCHEERTHLPYHTAAAADALLRAHLLGIPGAAEPARRAYAWLLAHRLPDGGWPWSVGDYKGLLRDRTAYPRYDAMVLHHLLEGAELS